MAGKILILSIEEDKYDSLVEALGRRPYLKILSMDREGRRSLSECPCCKKKLQKEQTFVINEQFVESLTAVAHKMSISKTVIIVNKENPISMISPLEVDRCVEADQSFVFRALSLGLIQEFIDGSKTTYFVTSRGLSFLSGESPASPSSLITLDGEVVETHGEIDIESVKYKDLIKKTGIIRSASSAVQEIPEKTKKFVEIGQMSLL